MGKKRRKEHRKGNRKTFGIFWPALILLGGFILLKQEITEEEKQVMYKIQDNYLDKLEDMKFQCPEVVVAQIILESAKFSSNIYKKNHNLVGMKKPKFRETYAIGENLGHAVYETDAHCLADYLKWQEYVGEPYLRKRGKTRFANNDEYMQFLLDVGYAEDKRYVKKLKNIIKYLYDRQ